MEGREKLELELLAQEIEIKRQTAENIKAMARRNNAEAEWLSRREPKSDRGEAHQI